MKMATEENTLITVAICTRNRAEFLEKAIRSVLPQLTPAAELIVVDNASTDNTRVICEQLAKEGGRIDYQFEPRLGISAARNLALRKARGKYVLFFDDDQIAGATWLKTFHDFLTNPPSKKIAAAGGGVIAYYTAPLPKWYALKNGCFDRGDKPLFMPRGGLAGGNCAFLKEAVAAVGLYDERLGYKGNQRIPREESELQERLIRAGWECWWVPGAPIRHHVSAERLTISGMAATNYYAGRAAAIHRLKMCTNRGQRFWLRGERLVVTPFHILINSVQTAFLFVIGNRAGAVGALCRITRAAGWAWQMIQIRSH